MEFKDIMAQAQLLQTKVASAQESLASKRVKGMSDKGEVIIDMTGKYDLISVNIDEQAMELGAKHLSTLVAEAYRDAKEKADVLIDKVMSDATANVKLPK